MVSQRFKDKVVHAVVNFVVAVVAWGFVFYLLLEELCK